MNKLIKMLKKHIPILCCFQKTYIMCHRASNTYKKPEINPKHLY